MQDSSTFFFGSSPEILNVKKDIASIAGKTLPVLITGESGTGKSRIAEFIHNTSGLNGKFSVFSSNNGNLFESDLFGHVKGSFTGANRSRPGKITQTDGGTLLFDEIGDYPPELQFKLLRLIETKTYSPLGSDEVKKANVRFIFATNKNLKQLVEEGSFRGDLYYRLNVIDLEIPPLRERKCDIEKWIDYLFSGHKQGINEEDYNFLVEEFKTVYKRYDWPGNLRELSNQIEKTIALNRVSDIEVETGNLDPLYDDKSKAKKPVFTQDEEMFARQSKIYSQIRTGFEHTIFDKIKLGEHSIKKCELLFVNPFIQIVSAIPNADYSSVLGITKASYAKWYHPLRDLGYLSQNFQKKMQGKSLPTGLNLTYQLRKLFIPHLCFMTVEFIKRRGVKNGYSSATAEAAHYLDISQKELLSELKQNEQNQQKLIELNIW